MFVSTPQWECVCPAPSHVEIFVTPPFLCVRNIGPPGDKQFVCPPGDEHFLHPHPHPALKSSEISYKPTQTKSTKLNLPNQTFKTEHIKPKLLK